MELARPGGWYPDPGGPGMLRYWDGHAWTTQVARPPVPGWYRDPADQHGLRYWGGTGWTTNVAPASAAAATTTLTAPPPGPTTTLAPPRPTMAPTTIAAPPTPPVATAVAPPPMPVAPLIETPPTPSAPGPDFAARAAAARLHATPRLETATAKPEPSKPEPAARIEPKRRRGAAIVALVAAVLLALAIGGYVVTKWGTGPAGVLHSSSSPSVQAPPGYHLVTLGTTGMSFAVRDSWLALDPNSSQLKEAEQRVAAANPQLASTLTDFGSSTSNIKFLAVDVGNRLYGSNVEILSLGLAKASLADPAGAQAAFRKQIPNAVATPATIAGTRGLLVTGTVNLTLPTGGMIVVHATGYVVGTSSGVFSMMFGTTDDGSQNADVQTALRTLHLS